jgi:uncharacterized protein YndB with AHSA1/START domain
MTTGPRATVSVSHRYRATPERVFDAWLDPQIAARWLFATPTGQIVKSEIDPRVGGAFVIVDRRDRVDVEHTGTYSAIDRPRRLAFLFSVPKYSSESTRVTVEILPLDTGCELRLTHVDVLPDYAERTEAGWKTMLGGLEAALG